MAELLENLVDGDEVDYALVEDNISSVKNYQAYNLYTLIGSYVTSKGGKIISNNIETIIILPDRVIDIRMRELRSLMTADEDADASSDRVLVEACIYYYHLVTGAEVINPSNLSEDYDYHEVVNHLLKRFIPRPATIKSTLLDSSIDSVRRLELLCRV